MTPLAWHTFAGNVSIVNLLIDDGANINADFDASHEPGIKITALDVAQGLIGKKKDDDSNVDDKFMQTYLALQKKGGKTYSQIVAGEAAHSK
jgi:ankyrin repeat protein